MGCEGRVGRMGCEEGVTNELIEYENRCGWITEWMNGKKCVVVKRLRMNLTVKK